MQWAILIGALVSALVIGGTLIAFNQAGTVYSNKKENVPDFTLTTEELARIKETDRIAALQHELPVRLLALEGVLAGAARILGLVA